MPVLVLRQETERPEAVEAGAAKLIGQDAERLVAETERLLRDQAAHRAMAQGRNPFGDGQAGRRIAAVVAQWLGQRGGERD